MSAVDYGSDFWCLSDLLPSLTTITGRTMLTQALYRRIITKRGTLWYDPNYGTDVRGWLNGATRPGDIQRKAARIDREFVKDTRVISSTTTPAFSTNVLTFTSIIVDGNGPFFLVLAVDAVTVTLLTPQP